MSRISYMVAALATISLVACKPPNRYTLHEGTDPLTGRAATMKLNVETGEVYQLSTINTPQGQWGAWTCYLSGQDAYKAASQLSDRTQTNNPRP
jgi:hypothetical protein